MELIILCSVMVFKCSPSSAAAILKEIQYRSAKLSQKNPASAPVDGAPHTKTGRVFMYAKRETFCNLVAAYKLASFVLFEAKESILEKTGF